MCARLHLSTHTFICSSTRMHDVKVGGEMRDEGKEQGGEGGNVGQERGKQIRFITMHLWKCRLCVCG